MDRIRFFSLVAIPPTTSRSRRSPSDAYFKNAIAEESTKLSTKVDDSQKTVLEKVEILFDRKFLSTAGAIVGCLAIMFGIVSFF
jgi:hypothetical protein